ncbi:IclR family transcriptional regulator [Pseudoponticoccus marisrubri]|uniref:HTH iclR-type domain-containing protein n=1 Tax=Pseudoponticoccus marisrubri TaxID=1685382 RepID=A0A0W7WEN5_9RHOB|nr:IclR family transcriptional regulator [Pseudoponticoccus marisrubri]KUF08964.1 hypothetical protein AVJ23_19945 [Pseudoponticoccus marisrubri]
MTTEKVRVERPVAAATRTLQILDAFAEARGPLKLSELAEYSGLFKSVVLRYLISFEKMGYVVKRDDGRYQLGYKALMLARSFEAGVDRRELIEAAMRRLVETTGESAFFYVCEGDNRLCTIGLDSPQALRVSQRVGAMVPMDDTSISQILTKYRDGAGDTGAYGPELLQATAGEYDKLTASASVPIFAQEGSFVGALTVSGPTARFDPFDPAQTAPLLDEGARLSRVLGFPID